MKAKLTFGRGRITSKFPRIFSKPVEYKIKFGSLNEFLTHFKKESEQKNFQEAIFLYRTLPKELKSKLNKNKYFFFSPAQLSPQDNLDKIQILEIMEKLRKDLKEEILENPYFFMRTYTDIKYHTIKWVRRLIYNAIFLIFTFYLYFGGLDSITSK